MLYINENNSRESIMNKIIITLLVGILGLNIYGFVIKDHWSLQDVVTTSPKTSKSCANLNETETFSCLKSVADDGVANGNDLMLLGQLYLYGMGTEVDMNQALSMFEKSVVADQNSDAMRLLGDQYVGNDLLSAKYWYARATQNGDVDASMKLAKIYRYGAEKEQDPEAAFALYKFVADKGSLDAQYELALMYATGTGIEPNVDRSIFMLERPCKQGHAPSCELLTQIQALKANVQ